MWRSDQTDVKTSSEAVLLHRAALAALKRRNAQILLEKKTPSSRVRREGIVGPEIDWSIRYARIWHSHSGTTGPGPYQLGRFPTWLLLQGKFQILQSVDKDTSPAMRGAASGLHHHLKDLILLNDDGVRRWTKLANWLGIRFNGEYGYDFRSIRKDRLGARLPERTHERSKEAALRRASRRRESRRFKKNLGARTISDPLVVRPTTSNSKLRRAWRRSLAQGTVLTWTQYRARVSNPPILVVNLPGAHLEVSEPVARALRKIYANKEEFLEYGEKPPKPLPRTEPVKYRVRYNLNSGHVEYDAILRRIQAIEEAGFHETTTWFSLNRRLEDLRSSKDIRPFVWDAH